MFDYSSCSLFYSPFTSFFLSIATYYTIVDYIWEPFIDYLFAIYTHIFSMHAPSICWLNITTAQLVPVGYILAGSCVCTRPVNGTHVHFNSLSLMPVKPSSYHIYSRWNLPFGCFIKCLNIYLCSIIIIIES